MSPTNISIFSGNLHVFLSGTMDGYLISSTYNSTM